MKNIYVVMGGLGKNILFTSLIPSLCKKDEAERISIITAWPQVFTPNEQVDQVLQPPGWKHEPILEQYDNIEIANLSKKKTPVLPVGRLGLDLQKSQVELTNMRENKLPKKKPTKLK